MFDINYLLFEFDITLHCPCGIPDETFYLHLTLIDTLVLLTQLRDKPLKSHLKVAS